MFVDLWEGLEGLRLTDCSGARIWGLKDAFGVYRVLMK